MVDVVLATLKATYATFSFSREARPETDYLLSKASKRGSDTRGRPDIIGIRTDPDLEDVVVFVEVKRSTDDHGEVGGNLKTQAVAGVVHYMTKAWEVKRARGPDLVGMAVSGLNQGQPELVSVFGIARCNSFGVGEPVVRDLGFAKIPDESRALELLYSFRGWPGALVLPKSSGYVAMLPSVVFPRLEVSHTINRSLRESHVEEIYEYLASLVDAGREPFIPGVIIIGVYQGKYHVLDGQHRYKALEKIQRDGHEFSFLVQLLPVGSKEELVDIYTAHYLAVEASPEEALFESLPPEWELAQDVVDGIITHLPKSSTKIFGRSATCPFVKTVTVIERLGIFFRENPDVAAKGKDFLIKKALRLNASLKAAPPTTSTSGVVYAARTLNIAAKAACYLGLVRPEQWFE